MRLLLQNMTPTCPKIRFYPSLFFREINRDPDQLSSFMSDQGFNLELVEKLIEQEITVGNISPITFPHLFVKPYWDDHYAIHRQAVVSAEAV